MSLANAIVRRPRPWIVLIPVAGVALDLLVSDAVGPHEDVARRPIRIRARAVSGPRLGVAAATIRHRRVQRVKEGHRIVERDVRPQLIADPLVALDGSQPIAPFEQGMCGGPLPNLVCVHDECVAVPKPNRLTLPLGELLLGGPVIDAGEDPSYLRCDEHVAQHEHLRGSDDELLGARQAADITVGKTEGSGPPMTSFRLRLHLLDVILTVCRGEGLRHRAGLDTTAVKPRRTGLPHAL